MKVYSAGLGPKMPRGRPVKGGIGFNRPENGPPDWTAPLVPDRVAVRELTGGAGPSRKRTHDEAPLSQHPIQTAGGRGVHGRRDPAHGLAQRHDLSRNLIRIWVTKYEAGAFDAGAADLLREPSALSAASRC